MHEVQNFIFALVSIIKLKKKKLIMKNGLTLKGENERFDFNAVPMVNILVRILYPRANEHSGGRPQYHAVAHLGFFN